MPNKADFPDTIYAFEPETKDGITGGIWCDKPTVAPDDAMSYLSVDQIRMIIAQRDDLQERVAEQKDLLEKARKREAELLQGIHDRDFEVGRGVLVNFTDAGSATFRWHNRGAEFHEIVDTRASEPDESYRGRLGMMLDSIRVAKAQS